MPVPDAPFDFDVTALRRYADRLAAADARLDAARKARAELLVEARRAGLDATALKQITRERSLDPEIRLQRYVILDDYRGALGLFDFDDTPLGEAATRQKAGAATGDR